MKKFKFLITMVVLVLTVFAPIMVMGQTEGGGGFDPSGYVATFALYIAFLLAAVEAVMAFVKNTDSRKIIIWVAAVVIGILAFILKLGIFYTTWYVGLLYVLAGGAVVSGYLTAEQGQMLIDLLKNLFKDKATLQQEAKDREIALRAKNQSNFQ